MNTKTKSNNYRN